MKKNLGLPFLVAVIVLVLASMGMSYATDKEVLFIQYGASDNDGVNGVGDVTVYVNQTGVLIVSVYNAYPGYEAYVTFTIKYIYLEGEEDPIYVTGINPNYPGTVMDIEVTDPDGVPIPINTPLYPNPAEDSIDVELTLTMLPGAEESQPYSFGVDIGFSDVPSWSLVRINSTIFIVLE